MKRIYGLVLSICIALAGVSAMLIVISNSSVMAMQPKTLETTIVVNTLVDNELNSDGYCSLREAIQAANTNASVDTCPAGDGVITDTINFAVAGKITLNSQLSVSDGGPLVINGASDVTVSGGNSVRVFHLSDGARLVLQEIIVADGYAACRFGGGIENSGHLTIIDSTITGNVLSSISETKCLVLGGGIYSSGTVDIIRSTVSRNEANGYTSYAGAIYINGGNVTIINSTFAENRTDGAGGGIYLLSGSITFTNSSVTGSSNGNVVNYGTYTMTNSIVAYPVSGANCSGTGTPAVDGGHNIEDSDTCGFDPANGSMVNTDPLLGPLQDNGGPTWTKALLEASPAIDAGDDAQCPQTDQRGAPRPIDGNGDGKAACDIGPYEFEEGIVLYPSPQIGGDIPGMMVTYTLGLYNYTPLTDTYALTSGGNAWQTSLSTSSIGPLMPGTSGTFVVSVAIPEDGLLGITDTLVISAASLTSPTIYSTTAHITTYVMEKTYLPQILQRAGIQ